MTFFSTGRNLTQPHAGLGEVTKHPSGMRGYSQSNPGAPLGRISHLRALHYSRPPCIAWMHEMPHRIGAFSWTEPPQCIFRSLKESCIFFHRLLRRAQLRLNGNMCCYGNPWEGTATHCFAGGHWPLWRQVAGRAAIHSGRHNNLVAIKLVAIPHIG